MKLERWLDSKSNIEILHDEKKGLILDGNSKILNDGEKKQMLNEKGLSLTSVRKDALKSEAIKNYEFNGLRFERFLYDKGMAKEAKQARNFDFDKYAIQAQKFLANASFAGGAILEGFFEFYGLEIDRSVDRYLNRLQIIETRENEISHFSIAKLDGEGNKYVVSPNYQDEKQARLALSNYLETQKRVESKSFSLSQSQSMADDNLYNKEH